LSIALETKKRGVKGVILPKENVTEAAVVSGIEVYGMESLPEVIEFLSGVSSRECHAVDIAAAMVENSIYEDDFADGKGSGAYKEGTRSRCCGLSQYDDRPSWHPGSPCSLFVHTETRTIRFRMSH